MRYEYPFPVPLVSKGSSFGPPTPGLTPTSEGDGEDGGLVGIGEKMDVDGEEKGVARRFEPLTPSPGDGLACPYF